ncbi:MAG: polyphosphate kinase 1 [Chloroflexi bacterium]|nr:polyphosphate kinase 1 [Chloroflexota bacterium]
MGTEQTPDAETAPPPVDLDDISLYENRELSWLDFNDRVLAEACDPRNPLLERVRFLAITSSNLDEFYSKRVAWLKQILRTNPGHLTVDGLSIAEQSALVAARCAAQRREIEACWHGTLVPALEARGVRVVTFGSLDPAARASLTDYFMTSVYPVLTPLVVDPAHPFPFISANSLSLALWLRDPRTGTDRFARVKVPQNRPRFVEAGDMRFVLLEDLIGAHLNVLFPGVEIIEHSMLRALRSIELGTPGEAAEDLLELIEREVRRRRLAEAVSLEVTVALTPEREELLLEELDLGRGDVVQCTGPLGLVDLHQVAGLPLADATFHLTTPAIPPAFTNLTDRPAFFAALQSEDMLVHHPYESFDATVARFIEEASLDPQVLAIKHTTYRTSPDSPILQSLIEASTRGKQVAVLVELTARLDEENNIEWARRLEEAGIHVGYGDPGRKVHSKITLVVREEVNGVVMYGHIGTGNYNSRTARVYTDLGLFTSDPTICSDLLRVFNHLTGMSEGFDTRELLVAPINLRTELERRVEREIEAARAGRPARIIFKMNALEDRDFTRLLYRAGQAGVQVDLIVRGICRLRPGVPGLSERIRVISIIGRFLEHSRAYYFENDGHPEIFIGSADLMKRNLDERIEVLTPIKHPSLRNGLLRTLEMLLADRRRCFWTWGGAWTITTATATPKPSQSRTGSPGGRIENLP